MKTEQTPRGEAVNAVMAELAFRTQLRKLAEQRERRRKYKGRDENCSTKSVRYAEPV